MDRSAGRRRIPLLAVAALAMLGVAGCSPTSSPPAGDGTAEETPAETSPDATDGSETDTDGTDDTAGAAGGSDLMVATTDLGEVVVDADGRTVYMFDNDTQGGDASACTGQCLAMWPPVLTTADAPTGTDVTGELGTIETPTGELQVTLNGWPVYLWVNDTEPGDVTGQGVNGIWWVLDPSGEPIRETPQSDGVTY